MPNQNQFPVSSSHPAVSPSSGAAIYSTANVEADPSLELALIIAQAADERKGEDIAILKVGDVSYLADYFVIISGFSKVQVRAIANAIGDRVHETLDRHPVRVEGLSDGNWILQDYGSVIVHIFMAQEREFYNLEAFWGHAERINVPIVA